MILIASFAHHKWRAIQPTLWQIHHLIHMQVTPAAIVLIHHFVIMIALDLAGIADVWVLVQWDIYFPSMTFSYAYYRRSAYTAQARFWSVYLYPLLRQGIQSYSFIFFWCIISFLLTLMDINMFSVLLHDYGLFYDNRENLATFSDIIIGNTSWLCHF